MKRLAHTFRLRRTDVFCLDTFRKFDYKQAKHVFLFHMAHEKAFPALNILSLHNGYSDEKPFYCYYFIYLFFRFSSL